MSSPAELSSLGDGCKSVFDRFRGCHPFYSVPTFSTRDLCAKGEQFILICDHHSPIVRAAAMPALHPWAGSLVEGGGA
jgi:hypothetical protein